MKSQVAALHSAPPLWKYRIFGNKITQDLRRIFSRSLTKQLLSATSLLALSVVMLGAFNGTPVTDSTNPTPHKDVDVSFAWLTTHPTPKVVEEATPVYVPPCAEDVINKADMWFSECPDMALNFALMPNGPINSDIFNIYTGSPEANLEAQLYTANQENVVIENGALVLRALNNGQGKYRYTSARIDTKGKKDFLYGRLEITATLPSNIGAWPAIWMLSTNRKYESLSPDTNFKRYLNDGELDIAESVGAEPNVVYGIAHSLAHPVGGPSDYFNTITVPGNDVTYHTYGIDWTPTKVSFTLDGRAYYTMDRDSNADYTSWPYDQPFYLILNLAVGGTWGGMNRAAFPVDGVDKGSMPFTMRIRSINYYSYLGR